MRVPVVQWREALDGKVTSYKHVARAFIFRETNLNEGRGQDLNDFDASGGVRGKEEDQNVPIARSFQH